MMLFIFTNARLKRDLAAAFSAAFARRHLVRVSSMVTGWLSVALLSPRYGPLIRTSDRNPLQAVM
ncbi:hypothetical protein [Klebsiella pneumoniae]|uniref:hypothetical protein n=1 Tax=Klebsiella pneumoniae TaxID=573 RepID=UPI0038909990